MTTTEGKAELSIRDSIALLKLNNFEKLNALSEDFVDEIYQLLENIEKRAVVLVISSGFRRAFVAGVDVNEIYAKTFESACRDNFMDHKWERVWRIEIPVIAAVSGYALGGGFELALMCDIILASSSAVFGFPEIGLGLMPGLGGTQMLTSIVGPKIASEIIMTGRFVSAEEALKLGIVSGLILEKENDLPEENSDANSDSLLAKALALAEKIATKSTMSARMIKRAIRLFYDAGISGGMKAERQMFLSLFSTEEKERETKAFVNKKKP
jgi:enoyl-CoA hydratase/carnithine racemase